MPAPVSPVSQQIQEEKYREPGETYEAARVRVAKALTDNEEHYNKFLEITTDDRFLAAGRVQAGAGSAKHVTLFNCFVSGTIHDSFVDGPGLGEDQRQISIMRAAEHAAQTMRQGGGMGFAFSTLRPDKSLIKTLQSTSDGPLAFMPIYDAVCKATSSAGNRRGAMMGVLRVDHPDIQKFISVKHDLSKLTGFNLSIGVTDVFMEAVQGNKPFTLTFNGEAHKTVDAAELWEEIMQSTWNYAEPGVLFLDTINKMNNLWYCEDIQASNPCGEQPLPPFGACLLGSINLPRYLCFDSRTQLWYIDTELLLSDIPWIVRAMDNVTTISRYPLQQQAIEAYSKRRMGIGITGLANALEMMGFAYGSEGFVDYQHFLMKAIENECYRASIALAKEKGAFPLFDAEKFFQGKHIKTLDDDVRWMIARYGIRNSHLTSVAPTGTISLAAENISSGIEPVFALEQQRKVNTLNGQITVNLQDWAYGTHGLRGKTTSEVTVKEHLDVLLCASKHVDSAVSKTINTDGNIPWSEFKAIYMTAWEGGAKGCTTFNKDGKRFGIMTAAPAPAAGIEPPIIGEMCKFDPATGKRDCG